MCGSDEAGHKKVHFLSRDKLCRPKKECGLGLRSTRKANSAFLIVSTDVVEGIGP